MGTLLSPMDFKLDILSDESLALVSEFALELFRRKGIYIDVHSDEALFNIFKYANICRDRRLWSIQVQIRSELRMKIRDTLSGGDPWLADKMLDEFSLAR